MEAALKALYDYLAARANESSTVRGVLVCIGGIIATVQATSPELQMTGLGAAAYGLLSIVMPDRFRSRPPQE